LPGPEADVGRVPGGAGVCRKAGPDGLLRPLHEVATSVHAEQTGARNAACRAAS